MSPPSSDPRSDTVESSDLPGGKEEEGSFSTHVVEIFVKEVSKVTVVGTVSTDP